MQFEDLSPEVQEKAKHCTTIDEVLALAKDEGVELSNSELESISGGWRTEENCRRYDSTIHL